MKFTKILKALSGKRLPLLGAVAFLLVGCGANGLAPEHQTVSLGTQIDQAVWHSELSGEPIQASPGDLIATEDGHTYLGSIVVPAPEDGSTYVHGVFSINIPDEAGVSFVSSVGFATGSESESPLIFRVYIQDGDEFPVLAEVTSFRDGILDSVYADLTPYRGQNRLLILSATYPLQPTASFGSALWIQPEIRTP